jgi:hypothetical protein
MVRREIRGTSIVLQEVLQFMLAVAMEENGWAKLINASQLDGRTNYT